MVSTGGFRLLTFWLYGNDSLPALPAGLAVGWTISLLYHEVVRTLLTTFRHSVRPATAASAFWSTERHSVLGQGGEVGLCPLWKTHRYSYSIVTAALEDTATTIPVLMPRPSKFVDAPN